MKIEKKELDQRLHGSRAEQNIVQKIVDVFYPECNSIKYKNLILNVLLDYRHRIDDFLCTKLKGYNYSFSIEQKKGKGILHGNVISDDEIEKIYNNYQNLLDQSKVSIDAIVNNRESQSESKIIRAVDKTLESTKANIRNTEYFDFHDIRRGSVIGENTLEVIKNIKGFCDALEQYNKNTFTQKIEKVRIRSFYPLNGGTGNKGTQSINMVVSLENGASFEIQFLNKHVYSIKKEGRVVYAELLINSYFSKQDILIIDDYITEANMQRKDKIKLLKNFTDQDPVSTDQIYAIRKLLRGKNEKRLLEILEVIEVSLIATGIEKDIKNCE